MTFSLSWKGCFGTGRKKWGGGTAKYEDLIQDNAVQDSRTGERAPETLLLGGDTSLNILSLSAWGEHLHTNSTRII